MLPYDAFLHDHYVGCLLEAIGSRMIFRDEAQLAVMGREFLWLFDFDFRVTLQGVVSSTLRIACSIRSSWLPGTNTSKR